MNPSVVFIIFFSWAVAGSIDPPKNMTQEFDERLEYLISSLRSYIRGPDFDSAGFQWRADSTEAQLLYLNASITRWWPHNNILINKLGFAMHIFRIMESAADILSFYNHNSTDHLLLRQVSKVKTRLLALYDPQGTPNPQIKGFANTFFRIRRVLCYWAHKFKKVELVEFGIKALFEKQVSDAKKALEELFLYLPRGSEKLKQKQKQTSNNRHMNGRRPGIRKGKKRLKTNQNQGKKVNSKI